MCAHSGCNFSLTLTMEIMAKVLVKGVTARIKTYSIFWGSVCEKGSFFLLSFEMSSAK